MKKATIIKERCPQSHTCPSMSICPVHAISQIGFSAPTINQDVCIGCGKCTKFCPKQALVLEEVVNG